MKKEIFSKPVNLKNIHVDDAFWHREQELVRKEVIPYQWEALNDRIPDAAPSYCMHNFKAAGRIVKEGKTNGDFQQPVYTFRGFEAKPEDPRNPKEDRFYGFVFQDSDFAKWIEAVGYSLIRHPDEELEKIADGAIDIVCGAQLDNGYLDTYYIINGMDRAFTNLRDHHELYCLGHLVEGAVAYYQATGKDQLLNAARRYADYVDSLFGMEEGKCKGYPGHEIAEMALVRLYEVTGEQKYLDLSRFFLDVRGSKPYYFEREEEEQAQYENRPYKPGKEEQLHEYYQAHKPVREQSEAVGHSVRAVYLYSGMADVARLTGDEEMFQACERLWNSITVEKMYITGGIGATHVGEAFSFPFDLPNDTAYSETCAAIGLVFFARRMLEINPVRKYGDVMERALYNGVLSGMALDGKSFFYVNPLEVLPEACKKDARKAHVKPIRQKWFGCACCPPNIARLVSSVASYAYTENADTLWTHLYMGSTLTKTVDGALMDLRMETGFPWNGGAKLSIHTEQSVKCTLAFRIPGWSREGKADVLCGGVSQKCSWGQDLTWKENGCCQGVQDCSQEVQMTIRDGYLYVTGIWQDGDSITLDYSMDVRMETADKRVRENIGKAAFSRGPIVFCMEEADNGKNLHLLKADKKAASGEGVLIKESEELGHKMLVLEIPGFGTSMYCGTETAKDVLECSLYQDYIPEQESAVTLKLIPYYAWNNRGEGEMSVWIRV